ncbi:MAG TPA: chemotaxis protein CheW [Anaeromyxobacteraceae bacterium]|nr:chemotaxis protein CheW [Anaeromyxobacteraceae bacterium]
MATPPAERKALLFSAGEVRLCLRLAQVREIVPAAPGASEARLRGGTVPLLPVAPALGLSPGPGAFAVVIEAASPLALQADALHGIVDLAEAEVFRLPARTALPDPPPFLGAVVARGQVALELDVSALGGAPLRPAAEVLRPAPAAAHPGEAELRFARGERVYAAPLSLLVQVLESVKLWPVPLGPPSHRGLLYHGRALHPVFDLAVANRDPAPGDAAKVLLLDAGGTAVGLLAERVLGVGEAHGLDEPERLGWDALFAP